VVLITAYLTGICVVLDRRNRRTWEQLVMRYQPGSDTRAEFRNAGVLVEMVDYACHGDERMAASLAESLRREAMEVRLGSVLGSLPWG
jgi:hypothetical protein